MGATDPTMDFCPVYDGEDACIRNKVPTQNDEMLGNSYGSSSRCFKTGSQGTNQLIQTGYTSSTDDGIRCLQTRCNNGGASIEVRVGTTGWVPCPTNGSAATINIGNLTGRLLIPPTSSLPRTHTFRRNRRRPSHGIVHSLATMSSPWESYGRLPAIRLLAMSFEESFVLFFYHMFRSKEERATHMICHVFSMCFGCVRGAKLSESGFHESSLRNV